MANPTQIKRKSSSKPKVARKAAENKPQKKSDVTPIARKAATTKPPAYLQAKLAVSHPQDSAEREADHVAGQIMRAAKETPAVSSAPGLNIHRASLEPAITPDKKETLALKPVPAAEHVQRRALPASDKIQRAGEADAMAGSAVDSGLEGRIEARRGGGHSLPAAVAGEMSARFNRNFDGVRIHTDREAANLCAQTNARAFTVGNDIFFAPGEFAPETDAGKELLAHELTHVVQQEGGAQRSVMRNGGNSTSPNESAVQSYSINSGVDAGTKLEMGSNKTLTLPTLKLPHLKERNKDKYPEPLEFELRKRPNTHQTENWRADVESKVTTQANNLFAAANAVGGLNSQGQAFLRLKAKPDFILFGTPDELKPRLAIPFWWKEGRSATFQVDHVREMQLGGEDKVDCSNYELLEADANMSAGRVIMRHRYERIAHALDSLRSAYPTATIPSRLKRGDRVKVERLEYDLPLDKGDGEVHWSLDDIKEKGEQGKQLEAIPASELQAMNAAGPLVLYQSAQGGAPLPAPNPGSDEDWIPRVSVIRWTPSSGQVAAGGVAGELVVNAFKEGTAARRSAGGVTVAPDYREQSWTVRKIDGINGGYIDSESVLGRIRNSLRLPGMSPLEFEQATVTRNGLEADGRVLSDVPLLRDADIRIRLQGAEVQVYKTFSSDEISLPPPLHIDGTDLTVFYGTQSGLGVIGQVDFSVDHLGVGSLGASASQAGGFELTGTFDFEKGLFDRASIEAHYRNHCFGGSGQIGIDNPNKIRGIRSANLQVNFEESAFTATGTVQPSIPGVQQAGLRVDYSDAAGLTIGGTLQLAPNPAIRSGSVDVTVHKQDETWKVSATGTAQPAIPGIDSTLTVSYDDGAFLAVFDGTFQRGMLSGNVVVGATNRTVDANGQPTGEAAPHAPIVVYGSGRATVQIAPWLQGTAGICFAPNGEVTVMGEIGLPNALEIFSIKSIDKRLFGMSTQIPVFPGIVAEVGGNLSAHASIGPGMLDQCRIGIEYNPSHEENTHITGDAHLNIPAEAGLRLAARAGIGLGITGASATGGLELGGTLGISGAAEAGVHIDWMPTTGLAIDAEGYLHAEPKFKFDVSGYVSVEALWVTIYDKSWELASVEVGSGLRFGVRFPIHYREGQPFDVSLDDVTFEVPDVDPMAMVRQLGHEIF